MNNMKSLIIILLACFAWTANGQDGSWDTLQFDLQRMPEDSGEVLTLENAMAIALEENYEIIISQNQAQQAQNDIFIGNAGFLPRINLTGSYQRSIQDTYIEFAGEMSPIDRENAGTTIYDAAAELSYTLFDGLSRFYRYEQLQEFGRRADVQTRLTVENSLFQVVQTYLNIARQKENYKINQQAVEISLQRLKRANNTYQYGGNTKLDVLNARVDLNTDSVNLAQAVLDLSNAKRDLNIYLGRSPSEQYTVIDNFEINLGIELETILAKAQKNNANLLLAQYSLNSARLDEKIAGAGRYPRLELNGSYGYNSQENEAGFIANQEQIGFQGGVSLNYALFDANVRSNQIQNAAINTQIEEENLALTSQQIKRDVLNAFATYQNNLYLLKKENDNLETAELNFERSQVALRLGQINSTQFREAQLNLIRARRSINDRYYNAKISEVRLYQLAGILEEE